MCFNKLVIRQGNEAISVACYHREISLCYEQMQENRNMFQSLRHSHHCNLLTLPESIWFLTYEPYFNQTYFECHKTSGNLYFYIDQLKLHFFFFLCLINLVISSMYTLPMTISGYLTKLPQWPIISLLLKLSLFEGASPSLACSIHGEGVTRKTVTSAPCFIWSLGPSQKIFQLCMLVVLFRE